MKNLFKKLYFFRKIYSGNNFYILKELTDKKILRFFFSNHGEYENLFQGFYIEKRNIDNMEKRRFFLLKNSHKKKKMIVVLDKDLNSIEAYIPNDKLIELGEDIYLYEEIDDEKERKIIVINKSKILASLPTTRKSFSKIKLEYLSEDKTLEAYKFNLTEKRVSRYEIFSKDSLRNIEYKKSFFLIPFFDECILLGFPKSKQNDNYKKERNEKFFHDVNIKKIFIESFNEEKKEIVLEIISMQTLYKVKKEDDAYEIFRFKVSYVANEELIYEELSYFNVKILKNNSIIGLNNQKISSKIINYILNDLKKIKKLK